MTLNDFLTFAAGVGAVAIVSWLWEYFGWFANVEPKQKQLIFFGFCAVIALGTYAIKMFVPGEVLAMIEPFFVILASIFAYLFLGNSFHAVTKFKDK